MLFLKHFVVNLRGKKNCEAYIFRKIVCLSGTKIVDIRKKDNNNNNKLTTDQEKIP